MHRHLFIHAVLHTLRSLRGGARVAGKIVTTGFSIFLLLYITALGYFLDIVLRYFSPGQQPVLAVRKYLLYYLVIDLLFRLPAQTVPGFGIRPYLHLPIKRRRLLRFFTHLSFVNIFNFFALVLFTPFAVKTFFIQGKTLEGTVRLVTIFIFILNNSLLVFWLKNILHTTAGAVFYLVLALSCLLVLETATHFSLAFVSARVFDFLFTNHPFILLPVALFALLYLLTGRLLGRQCYRKSELVPAHSKTLFVKYPAWLENKSELGRYIALEIKMLWRNKRARTMVLLSFCAFLAGFLMFNNLDFGQPPPGNIRQNMISPNNTPPGTAVNSPDPLTAPTAHLPWKTELLLVYMAVLMTGIFLLTLGRFFFALPGRFWDRMMVSCRVIRLYFKAKIYIIIACTILVFFTTLSYGLMDTRLLFLLLAGLLYNLGISLPGLLFLTLFTRQRLDLNAAVFSQQDRDKTAELYILLPFFILPAVIYMAVRHTGNGNGGFFVLAAMGVLGIVLFKLWFRLFFLTYQNQKYKLAKNLRTD